MNNIFFIQQLKSVAIKLKKRVAELTAQLNSSEETRNKLATEKDDLKKKFDTGAKDNMKTVSKNIQVDFLRGMMMMKVTDFVIITDMSNIILAMVIVIVPPPFFYSILLS